MRTRVRACACLCVCQVLSLEVAAVFHFEVALLCFIGAVPPSLSFSLCFELVGCLLLLAFGFSLPWFVSVFSGTDTHSFSLAFLPAFFSVPLTCSWTLAGAVTLFLPALFSVFALLLLFGIALVGYFFLCVCSRALVLDSFSCRCFPYPSSPSCHLFLCTVTLFLSLSPPLS